MSRLRSLWRWLGAGIARIAEWSRWMAGRKVLVQDDGTGHMAYVEEGPTILLTGNATSTGHFFVGPDDPADTPAYLAILEPGDQWTDTTGGVPFQHKERNDANDGWDIASMVLKNGAGDHLARVDITPDGTVGLSGGFDLDSALPVSVYISPDGSAGIISTQPGASCQVKVDATGAFQATNDNGGFYLTASGALSIAGFFTLLLGDTGELSFGGPTVILSALPTSDPVVAGALWNDTGTVKVSAG